MALGPRPAPPCPNPQEEIMQLARRTRTLPMQTHTAQPWPERLMEVGEGLTMTQAIALHAVITNPNLGDDVLDTLVPRCVGFVPSRWDRIRLAVANLVHIEWGATPGQWEAIYSKDGDLVCEYLNAGDPYRTTLIYSHLYDEWVVNTLGHIVEALEADGIELK